MLLDELQGLCGRRYCADELGQHFRNSLKTLRHPSNILSVDLCGAMENMLYAGSKAGFCSMATKDSVFPHDCSTILKFMMWSETAKDSR